MEKYFALNYEGTTFELFGAQHLIALAIITLCCFSYLYFRKVWGEKERNIVRWVFAITIAVVIGKASISNLKMHLITSLSTQYSMTGLRGMCNKLRYRRL
jgi:hypothetical protein